MKEIHNLYLLAILGLLTIMAFGVTTNITTSDGMVNTIVISIFILFFIGFYGIEFTVKKNKIQIFNNR